MGKNAASPIINICFANANSSCLDPPNYPSGDGTMRLSEYVANRPDESLDAVFRILRLHFANAFYGCPRNFLAANPEVLS